MFKHDCKDCKPLGQFEDPKLGQVDLYFCSQGRFGDTVIARYGNEPHQYQSGLAFADTIPALNEAKDRAIKLEYIKPGYL